MRKDLVFNAKTIREQPLLWANLLESLAGVKQEEMKKKGKKVSLEWLKTEMTKYVTLGYWQIKANMEDDAFSSDTDMKNVKIIETPTGEAMKVLGKAFGFMMGGDKERQ